MFIAVTIKPIPAIARMIAINPAMDENVSDVLVIPAIRENIAHGINNAAQIEP
jgi:hypothetical protein